MSSSVDRFLQRTGSVDAPPLPLAVEHAPDPDRAARILKAQQATGLSGDIVARQLDQIEAAEKAKQLQGQQLAPVTKAFIAEDPTHAAIAAPDASKLSYLERQLRHVAQEFGTGKATVRLTGIGTAAILGRATEEQRAEQAAIEAELGSHVDYGIGQGLQQVFHSRGPDGDAMYAALKAAHPVLGALFGASELAEQIPGAAAQQLPITASQFGAKAIGAGVGAAGGAAVGAATGPGALATGAAGAALGWKLGGVPQAAMMEASTAYLDFEKLRDEKGNPLDRRLMVGAALLVGAVNGTLEGLSLEELAKTLPGIRTIGRKGMRELLAKQTTRQALEHSLKAIGESALTEGSTEFLQEYVTNLAGRIIKLNQDGKAMSVGEFLDQTVGDPQFFTGALEAGKGGLLAALGTGGAGSVISVANKAVQVRRAERRADVFKALADGAQSSELLARLPAKHQELVERMTKHGPLENVYVPAERFTEYFQGVGLDPSAVAGELLGSTEAYDEAQRTGGWLAIPTGAYATKLAGSEHHAGLVEDLTFSPTELSHREAKAAAAELDAESEAQASRERAPLEAAEAVTEHVTEQLRRAGFNERTARTYASALYGSPMRVLASRLGTGVTAEQLLERFNLRISRPGTEGAPQLPSVDVERIRQAHVATRAAALERVGKVTDTDGGVRYAAPRTPGGARRPVERVSTKGLLAELLDLEEKRADAESRSVYELREDPNFHTEGIPQIVSTKDKAGGPSRQAKALTNLDDYRRITDQVHGELAKRGLDERSVFDAVEDLRAELDERAAQAGDFDGTGRGAQLVDEAGNVLFQPAPPIDSPAFRAWFGDSKVVDADGQPLVVFHGTTRSFDEFNRAHSDIEADQGAGFYFTNTEEDVEANYAGVGPDLKNKIEHRAEELGHEIGAALEAYQAALDAHDEDGAAQLLEDEPELTRLGALAPVDENGRQWRSPRSVAIDELATARATAELTEHQGSTMAVFLSLQNPVVLGGDDETTLTFSEPFDEETEEYGEASGTLLEFVDELDRVASRYDDADTSELRRELFGRAAENDGELSVRELEKLVKAALPYATDPESGKVANHEIMRQALEGMGFDGVIDHTVNEKFGDARSAGQSMEGMHGGTTHYVAFHPEQIKSATANRGTFDPRSPNILEQRAYHGSAHIFPNFSLEHIGSGEGAQVYGWGLYFAGKKAVAQWYRDKLAPGRGQAKSDLLELPGGGSLGDFLRHEADVMQAPGLSLVRALTVAVGAHEDLEAMGAFTSAQVDRLLTARRAGTERHSLLVAMALEELQQREEADTKFYRQTVAELEPIVDSRVGRNGQPLTMDALERHEQALTEAQKRISRVEYAHSFTRQLLERLDQKIGDERLRRITPLPSGRLYTVELQPDAHEWLDWDKPLVEQAPNIIDKIGELAYTNVVTLGDFVSVDRALAQLGYGGLKASPAAARWGEMFKGFLDEEWSVPKALERVEKSALSARLEAAPSEEGQRWLAARDEFIAKVRASGYEARVEQDVDRHMTGEDLYHELEQREGGQQQASEWLRERGIPGIRYLDGVSRSAGEGDHNFVIFDDKLIEIREYEQAIEHAAADADPTSTLFLDKLLGDHDLALQIKLAPLLKGNEIAKAGTVRQFYDELVLLVASGAFDQELGDADPVTSPAVRVGQALYRGASHRTAQLAAQSVGARIQQLEEGFATKSGAFLTRDEAHARSQLRVDPHAGVAQLLAQLGIHEIRLGQIPVDMREYEQAAPARRRELIVQHNITAENLLHAEDVGGLAMPSVAITHQDKALTGFGEITLLGDQTLVDPRKSRRTRIFGADVYSPRYPEVETTLSPRKLAQLDKQLARFTELIGSRDLRDKIERLERHGRDELLQHAPLVAAFLESRGAGLPDLGHEAVLETSRYNRLIEAVHRHGLYAEFEAYAREQYAQLEPKQRIRDGWDANGNAKYIRHSLANVMKLMRRSAVRGGEITGAHYGLGSVRAHYAPEFRTVAEIREAAAAGLVSSDHFENLRDEIEGKLEQLTTALAPYSKRSSDPGWDQSVMGLLEDAARMPLERALAGWDIDVAAVKAAPWIRYGGSWDETAAIMRKGGASQELVERTRETFGVKPIEGPGLTVLDQLRDFQEQLRSMPTEYFEAKYLRAVDPAEFKVAVVPHTTPARVRELLTAKGLAIAEYEMGDPADRKRVIQETAQQHDLLFQKPSDPRGRIRIGNHSMEIELLEKANLSTFIHETGHFYLEVLGSLAGEDTAPAQIRGDYATLLTWMGASSRAELTTEQHEKFARAFEAYLLEGEAPSAELRSPFARIRTWLVSVYRSIKALRVELTPDVRQVFDRLFATDEEIAAAEAEQHVTPLFGDPAAAGMSAGMATEYSNAVGNARMAALDELTAKAMVTLTRERKAWWQEERERTRVDVADQVHAEPLSRALAMLQKGTLPDGSPLPEGLTAVKLSKQQLVEAYGKELVKALPRGLYAKEGGISADDAAALFGFGTGGELLQALSSAEKIPARIDRLTDERMRQVHGDLLTDGTMPEAAMRAVHNVDRGRVLRLELEHLLSNDLAAAKGMLRRLARRIPSTEDSRELARATIASKRIREIQPGLYQRAEAKAAQLAIDHFTKGDVEQAFAEKLRELSNYELYRAAAAAKEEADKIVELMRSFDRPAVRARIGKAGGDYLEQIDAIRDRYSFTRLTERQLRNRHSLRDLVARAAAEGTELDIPPAVVDEAHRQHWKETPLEELQGVRDAVEQLAHLARTKNKLLANERTRNLEDARTELTAGAAEYFDLSKAAVDLTKPLRETLVSAGRGGIAVHTRMEFLFTRLDGFKANGPFWTHFFQPFARAEDLENTMRRNDADAMKEILGQYSSAERRAWFTRRIDVPGAATSRVRGTFTKANLLAVALNWGNAYNRAALLEGYGWNEAQVEQLLSQLDARDARFVQAIWDHIDSYWPAAEQLEREITGLAPAKVEASPLTIAGVQLRGGYYPIAFDREQSSRQTALDLAASVSDMAKGYGAKAMTRHGHLVERTSTGGKPLLLELSVINQHLGQVTHDLSHRRAVIDASKLIRDPEIQATIEGAVGREMYQQLGPWLSSIAGDAPTNAIARLERIASRARMGATAVGLGLNITSSFVQTLGYSNSVAELGAEYSIRGLRDAYAKPWGIKATWDFVTSRSSSMRDRLGNFDREVRDLARKPGALDTLGVDPSFMYQLIGWMDMGVSIPTWLGAYRKGMDGKVEGITAGDERAAIDYADSLVRTTQAAGAAKDLAAVQRGSQWWKLNTAFYSSMSILFNQFAKIPQRYALDKNAPKAIASMMLVWFLPAVLEDVLRGRGPEPDDDKLAWAMKKIALYPLSTVVLVRDFASALDRSLEYGRVQAPTTAVSAIIESAVKTTKAAIDVARGEDLTRADLREAFNTTGYFAQWPTRQLWKTGEYFHDWWTGSTTPDSPLDAFWGAVRGTPKEDRTR